MGEVWVFYSPLCTVHIFLSLSHALYLSTAIRISLRLALTEFELIYCDLSSLLTALVMRASLDLALMG